MDDTNMNDPMAPGADQPAATPPAADDGAGTPPAVGDDSSMPPATPPVDDGVGDGTAEPEIAPPTPATEDQPTPMGGGDTSGGMAQ